MNTTGKFIISLDFELLWGVRDKKTPDSYGENIMGVWEAIPKMLEAFEKHNVKGTWATVGFLFASSKKELLEFFPSRKPNYLNKNLSPYNGHFELLDDIEEKNKYHFASSLIDLILKYPKQEIATHTFSHYYCLEPGQTKEDFKDDTLAALQIAKKKNITLRSLVFPRNQFNDEYLEIIKDLGITSYRGNERVWFYDAANAKDENLRKRVFRLLDTYINISGHNCYSLKEIAKKEPYDIPSSRFLRPYSQKLKQFEKLRLRRILKSMTHAAKRGEVFHLWWHPHNFGINQKENLNFLNDVLTHYAFLNEKYGFESVSMEDLSTILQQIDINE
ncbi:MAG: polysaccharide deacetylase [Winogradskyella sp.]|uniref:polysaccharide deacetylase family protein n=1 Tax=Winogradskyella sp. TaxID=1883156 RepID=UPI000F3F5258|nr:polysaccharide deacetylase family protein [Winogradskyella sp.]RNC88057.1 MAG: polysaccharide deacetylase [Winogradskyella sp.]